MRKGLMDFGKHGPEMHFLCVKAMKNDSQCSRQTDFCFADCEEF